MGIGSKFLGAPARGQSRLELSVLPGGCGVLPGGRGVGDAKTPVFRASKIVRERRLQQEALRVQTEAFLEGQCVKCWTAETHSGRGQ